MDINQVAESAKEVAVLAGQLIVDKLSRPLEIKNKGFRDTVTESDYASQALIKQYVMDKYPTHGFIAEEEDSLQSTDSAEIRWIIDPIDGTSNYSRHIPAYTVSIGIAVGNEVVIGVVYDPSQEELFWGIKGQGAYLNDTPITVSSVAQLQEAVVTFDWSRPAEVRQHTYEDVGSLIHTSRTLRAFGSAALALAWVASGRVDCYFNPLLGAWDIAAGALLIAEAGGKTSAHNGDSFDITDSDSWYLSTNGTIHEEVRTVLQR